jgi:hypothetical protein
MQELINKEKAVELFAQRGHFFYPEQLKGIGEITVLYIGPDKYYTRCNTTQFCKRLIRAFLCRSASFVTSLIKHWVSVSLRRLLCTRISSSFRLLIPGLTILHIVRPLPVSHPF